MGHMCSMSVGPVAALNDMEKAAAPPCGIDRSPSETIELLIHAISGELISRLQADSSWTVAQVILALAEAAPLPLGAEYQLVLESHVLKPPELLFSGPCSGRLVQLQNGTGSLGNVRVYALTACVTQSPIGEYFLERCHVDGQAEMFAAKLKLSAEGQVALVLHSHCKGDRSEDRSMNIYTHPGTWKQDEQTAHIVIREYSVEFEIAARGDLRLLSNGSLAIRAVGAIFERGDERMRNRHTGGSKLWQHLVEEPIAQSAMLPRVSNVRPRT